MQKSMAGSGSDIGRFITHPTLHRDMIETLLSVYLTILVIGTMGVALFMQLPANGQSDRTVGEALETDQARVIVIALLAWPIVFTVGVVLAIIDAFKEIGKGLLAIGRAMIGDNQ